MNNLSGVLPNPFIPNVCYIKRPDDVFRSLSITDMLQQVSKTTYKTGYTSSKSSWLQTRPIDTDDLASGFNVLKETALQSAQKALLPLLFSKNAQCVPDDYKEELTSTQIRQTEMGFYIFLINHIARGATSLQVAQNSRPEFKQIVLDQIQMLLTRPSGRLVILSATRSNIPIIIKESQTQSTNIILDNDTIVITFNIHEKLYNVTLTEDNEPVLFFDPLYLVLGHELIHSLNYLSIYSKLWETKGNSLQENENASHIFHDKTRDPAYNNLMELLAIEGIPGFPSENMLNYEFGNPPRYGHLGCLNQPEPIKKIPTQGLAYDPKKIEHILNLALLFGDKDDFQFVYPLLSAQQINESVILALYSGCIPILEVLKEDIKNVPHSHLQDVLSSLLSHDSHTNTLHFLFTQLPAYIDFINPKTGMMPIHFATYKNCIQNVKLILALKNDTLFAKDVWNQTPCDYAITSKKDMFAILNHFFECNPHGVYRYMQSVSIPIGHPNTIKFLEGIRNDERFASPPQIIRFKMSENAPSPKQTLAELNSVLSPKLTFERVVDEPSFSQFKRRHISNIS